MVSECLGISLAFSRVSLYVPTEIWHSTSSRTMAQQSDTQRAQQILGYEFQNLGLIQEALQAPGLGSIVNGAILRHGNKNLALVGQSVLEMSIHVGCYTSGSTRGM